MKKVELESILGPFWMHFGPILLYLDRILVYYFSLKFSCNYFEFIFISIWDIFELNLSSFWWRKKFERAEHYFYLDGATFKWAAITLKKWAPGKIVLSGKEEWCTHVVYYPLLPFAVKMDF